MGGGALGGGITSNPPANQQHHPVDYFLVGLPTAKGQVGVCRFCQIVRLHMEPQPIAKVLICVPVNVRHLLCYSGVQQSSFPSQFDHSFWTVFFQFGANLRKFQPCFCVEFKLKF